MTVVPDETDHSDHDAAMADIGDKLENGETDVKPTEKENKQEHDWEKRYKDLQTKYNQKFGEEKASEEDAGATESDDSAAGDSDKTPDDLTIPDNEAEKTVSDAGLDWEALNQEFAEGGELSTETYESLESKGIPKDVVDLYIAGRTALVEKMNAEVHEAVGGKDNYTAMLQWAQDNMSPEEQAAYNKAVAGSKEETMLAVQGLKAQYIASEGSTPNLVDGSNDSAPVGAYESWAQVQADMRKPEYKSDPAFQAEVRRKLGKSNL